MTALVQAQGMTRRAPAALTGSGDASASRALVGLCATIRISNEACALVVWIFVLIRKLKPGKPELLGW
jgi:hypothetical protein